jgi:uncharacterized protein YcgL (UPF0745 family)
VNPLIVLAGFATAVFLCALALVLRRALKRADLERVEAVLQADEQAWDRRQGL